MGVKTPSGYILFIKSVVFTAGAEDWTMSDILRHSSWVKHSGTQTQAQWLEGDVINAGIEVAG